MDSIRILHIIPGFGGGISTFVKNLITAPNSDNMIMDIVGFGQFPVEYVEAIKRTEGNVYSLPNSHKHPIKFLMGYQKLLKGNEYSMIHCHFSGWKGLVFKAIAKTNRKRLIATHAHRTNDETKKIPQKLSIYISRLTSGALTDIAFTCSDLAAEFIYGKNFVRKHPIYMIPNAIDADIYKKQLKEEEKKELLESIGVDSNLKIIGHIGRFNIQKNHTFIIQMAEELRRRELGFVILLLGDGELYNDIRTKSKEKELDGKMKFLGKRSDVHRLLQIMDVMILPSLYEGLPTVAVESQAAGTPIVMSDTITTQADLGLGLVSYLPIDHGVKPWVDRIIDMKVTNHYSTQERLDILGNKAFTAKSMRQLYYNALKTKIIDNQRLQNVGR